MKKEEMLFLTKRLGSFHGEDEIDVKTERIMEPKSRMKCMRFNWTKSEALKVLQA